MKAVIFDIDDTLISEYDFVLSGYRACSAYLEDYWGIPKQEIYESFLKLSESSFQNIFDRLYEELGKEPEPKNMLKLIEIYSHHTPEVRFYEDVIPALTKLRELGMRIGIISDGDPARQHNKLKAAGGEELFDRVIITDELGDLSYRKPDPRSFRMMFETFSCTGAEALYVGDNPAKDFYLSRELSIKTARIIRPHGIYTDREYREGIRETRRIESLLELPELVRS